MDEKKAGTHEEERIVQILVKKCQEGELEPFGEIVSMFREKAFGLAFSYLGHSQDAEDASQEAFIRAFRKIRSYDPRLGTFGSWLMKIVVNLSINKIRWKKLRRMFLVPLDSPVDQGMEEESLPLQVAEAPHKSDPSILAESSAEKEQISRAMVSLPPQQRTALHLKFVQGYKISEVAKIMGLAEGTVKSHLFRGIESLKGALK